MQIYAIKDYSNPFMQLSNDQYLLLRQHRHWCLRQHRHWCLRHHPQLYHVYSRKGTPWLILLERYQDWRHSQVRIERYYVHNVYVFHVNPFRFCDDIRTVIWFDLTWYSILWSDTMWIFLIHCDNIQCDGI